MNSDNNSSQGVSPVIGMILMLVIVILLASLIGFFLLSAGGDVQNTALASIDIEISDSEVKIQVIENNNVSVLRVQRPDGSVKTINNVTAGNTTTIPLSSGDAGNYTIVGVTPDNEKQILRNKEIQSTQISSGGGGSGSSTLADFSYDYNCYECDSSNIATYKPGESFDAFYAPNTLPGDDYANKMKLANTGSSSTNVKITVNEIRSDENDVNDPERQDEEDLYGGSVTTGSDGGELDKVIKIRMYYINDDGGREFILGNSSDFVYAKDISSSNISTVPISGNSSKIVYVDWVNDNSRLASYPNVTQSDKLTFNITVSGA